MNFEKYTSSPLYAFFDILYKLIILNVLTIVGIIMGLGIFGILPSFCTMIICLKDMREEREFRIFKGFFKTYFKILKKTIILSLVNIMVILIQTAWVYYFYCWLQEKDTFIFGMLYYLSLFISVVLILTIINECFVFVYFPYLNKKKIIKYSFLLLIGTTWKALIMFVILLVFIYLAVALFYPLPFILLSCYFYIYNRLIYNDYIKIVKDGEEPLNVSN